MSLALLDAFRLADTPPCDKYSCSQRSRCSEEELACSAFEFYASSGEVVHPYTLIRFSATGMGRPIMRLGEFAVPSRATFERLFND